MLLTKLHNLIPWLSIKPSNRFLKTTMPVFTLKMPLTMRLATFHVGLQYPSRPLWAVLPYEAVINWLISLKGHEGLLRPVNIVTRVSTRCSPSHV